MDVDEFDTPPRMPWCIGCGRDTEWLEGCAVESYEDFADGITRPRIGVGEVRGGRSHQLVCGDCGADEGTYHHVGCDWEICPRCREQANSCECVRAGEKRNLCARLGKTREQLFAAIALAHRGGGS